MTKKILSKTLLKKKIISKTKKIKNIKKKTKFVGGSGIQPFVFSFPIEKLNHNSYYVSYVKTNIKYDFAPLELSVDRLQYALNTKSLKIDGDKISFTGTMPSLLLEEGKYFTGTKGKDADNLIDVIDDYKTLVNEDTNLANYNKTVSKYEFNIKVKDMISGKYKNRIGFENIEYVKQNAKSLEEIINNLEPKNRNAENITCDLAGIPLKYIIIDHSITDYVICGYPAHFKMRPYIELLETQVKDMNTIYQDHEANYMTYCMELYNFLYNTSNTPPTLKSSIENESESEIYKFYEYNDVKLFDITLNTFENYKTINNTFDFDDFKKKFTTYYKEFNNTLATTYLKKPMCRIKYIFLVYKKIVANGRISLVPAFYNIKELKTSDSNILERIKILINVEIPRIYKIPTTDNDTNLFYSYSNFGKFFCVKTEYLHTMSNINEYAFVYKNNITLEELIYAVKLSDLNTLSINYQIENRYIEISKLNIAPRSVNKIQAIQPIPPSNSNISLLSGGGNNNVSSTNSITTTTTNSTTTTSINSKIITEQDNDVKVILMLKQSGHKYTIIVRIVNKTNTKPEFYIMTIESILDTIDINSFDKLLIQANKSVYTCGTRQIKIVKTDLNIFKITSFKLLTINDYKPIKKYNPLFIRTISKNSTNPYIDIDEFYKIKGIETISSKFSNIPNIFLYKPILIINILSTTNYIVNHTKFIKEYNKNNDYISNYKNDNVEIYSAQSNDISKSKNTNVVDHFSKGIVHIFFNPNNCKYNLIEIKEATKSVVWVVPCNSKHTELKKETNPNYLSNCLDLNETHIPLLQFIIDTYDKDSTMSYLNLNSISFVQMSLHFHILNEENYKSTFTTLEQNVRLDAMISTKKVLNNLNFNNNYYNNFNVNVLMYL
jgi:hypothetical protein